MPASKPSQMPAYERTAGTDQQQHTDLGAAALDVHANGVADHEQRGDAEQQGQQGHGTASHAQERVEALTPRTGVLDHIDTRGRLHRLDQPVDLVDRQARLGLHRQHEGQRIHIERL
jgi:hypothetical protein